MDLAAHHALYADDAQVQSAIKVMIAPLQREEGENPGRIYDEMRDMMQAKVGIIRTKEEMQEAIEDLKAFDERQDACFPGASRKYNSGWHQALDLKNMVDVSIAATLAALTREESRGGHTRDDFPGELEEWGEILNVIRFLKFGLACGCIGMLNHLSPFPECAFPRALMCIRDTFDLELRLCLHHSKVCRTLRAKVWLLQVGRALECPMHPKRFHLLR